MYNVKVGFKKLNFHTLMNEKTSNPISLLNESERIRLMF